MQLATPEAVEYRRQHLDAARKAYPGIAIGIYRAYDVDAEWDDECGPEPDGCLPWVYEVTARTIVDGRLFEGHAYLGACWEPSYEEDPAIGGYLPQLVGEAIKDCQDAASRGVT